jgi:hypothetical protein
MEMVVATRGIPSAVTRLVRSMPGELSLRAEVADALNVAVSTLQKVEDTVAGLGPSYLTHFRGSPLYLYKPSDVTELREHFDRHARVSTDGLPVRRTGHPRLWNDEERKRRQAQQCRVGYLRSRAQKNAERGLAEVAVDYQRRADQLKAELREEYVKRFAHVTRPRVHEWP